ncbi:MAG: hypothetical protein AABY86_11160, partial [Bdellovibrionota bacterium]
IPDVDEVDKTRRIIQVPKLCPSSKTSVDLTFFFKNGQARLRPNAILSMVEAPIIVLDIMAKKLGESGEVNGGFFERMAEMENCWVMKDLFHSVNIPDVSSSFLRLSLKIQPEVYLDGVPALQHVSEIKLKVFSIGEEGDVASLEPTPRWVNTFNENIEIGPMTDQEGYKAGSIAIDFDQGQGLEFLLGHKRQLGLCIDDFSYEINKKKRTVDEVIKKAKLNGIALNYSNGLKYFKIYYVKGVNLAQLFTLIGKEYEITSDGKFVLDSRINTPFEVDNIEHLMDEDLPNGPWISATEMSHVDVTKQSSNEDFSNFLMADFAPKLEVGLFALPIYKILKGVYKNTNFELESETGTDRIQLPKLTPGGEFDIILSAQERIPTVSELKVISVEACVNISRDRHEKNQEKSQDCGGDYRGWCGIYHRDLEYMNEAKVLSEGMLNDIKVAIGERTAPLKNFIDNRFTIVDRHGRIHLRFRNPLTLATVTWLLPKLNKDYDRTFGFERFEKCDHRKLGRDFRFLNYAGVVTGNQKSIIKWQLQNN